MPIKTTASTFLNQNSKDFSLLNTLPTPETVKASSHAKITMGSPAARENGKLSHGEFVVMISGISMAK